MGTVPGSSMNNDDADDISGPDGLLFMMMLSAKCAAMHDADAGGLAGHIDARSTMRSATCAAMHDDHADDVTGPGEAQPVFRRGVQDGSGCICMLDGFVTTLFCINLYPFEGSNLRLGIGPRLTRP